MTSMVRTWERGRIAAVLAVVGAAALWVAGCEDGAGPPVNGEQFIDLAVVAEGLTAPVTLKEAPDGTGRLFVVDQAGQIRIIDAAGTLRTQPFLDLSGAIVTLNPAFDERGLLGLAFHPGYATNGRFFVLYSAPRRAGTPEDFNHTAVISEFTVSADANVADPGSERVLLEVPEPQFNHNGGTLLFGPDGFLYISLGDGGGGDDTGPGHVEDWYEVNEGGNAQNIEANLLGKILRIDVDSGDPYGIPADNPFVGEAGLDEIFAYGFRNPYRMSVDMGGVRQVIVGDAGQELFEEINSLAPGANFGWNVKEGTSCFNTDDPETPRAECPDTDAFGNGLFDPVIEYRNAKQGHPDGIGIVVVGGYVYRGSDIPDLEGRYIFGDYSTAFQEPDGTVMVADPVPIGTWDFEELRFGDAASRIGSYILGFGQDLDGEVYVLTSQTGTPSGTTGRVLRLVLD